jgi:hypothetical protein
MVGFIKIKGPSTKKNPLQRINRTSLELLKNTGNTGEFLNQNFIPVEVSESLGIKVRTYSLLCIFTQTMDTRTGSVKVQRGTSFRIQAGKIPG